MQSSVTLAATDDTTNAQTLTVRVWRGGKDGGLVDYEVPARENQTVLDVVTEIQRHHEPALTYRFACRVGVCGSCAMVVNGAPTWTCRTHVSKVAGDGALTIEPLRNLPLIKDLAVDMTPFFEKWERAGGVFEGTKTRYDDIAAISPDTKKRKRADAAIECINCAVCYAACDTVAWDETYLGPAALNRAWTNVNDERHAHPKGVLNAATAEGGCGSC
ncbi:MAG: 2Fe-2S iron-sulfur cluster-binding protein, partial [Pseudomonadota bacterium]